MENSKTKIINSLKKLNEAVVEPDELQKNIDDLVVTAKDSLDIDDEQAKDFVSGIVGEEISDLSDVNAAVHNAEEDWQMHLQDTVDRSLKSFGIPDEVRYAILARMHKAYWGGYDEIRRRIGGDWSNLNDDEIDEASVSKSQQRFMGMVYNCKKTGDCASDEVKKAAAGMSEKDAEDFASTKHKGLPEKVDEYGDEDYERAGREIEYGINPEVGADEYEELRRLRDELVNGGEETGELEESNNPEKLKRDVSIVMNKLDMSSIAPYIKKIDNPVEQAEMIGQFAEKIGVPRNKLSSVVNQMKAISKNDTQPEQTIEGRMTKKKLIEAVTGKKVIKTIKVKDIK